MATLNISDDDLAFIHEQVATGASPTPEDYISQLIRTEQRRRAKTALEAEILKGINSGPATPITAEFWDDVRRRVRERLSVQDQP
jgi:antitoxin ParD1/3/4